jgi:hypothetical protein
VLNFRLAQTGKQTRMYKRAVRKSRVKTCKNDKKEGKKKRGTKRTQDTEQTEERHKINRVTYNPENGKTESKDDENYEVHGKGQGGNNKI